MVPGVVAMGDDASPEFVVYASGLAAARRVTSLDYIDTGFGYPWVADHGAMGAGRYVQRIGDLGADLIGLVDVFCLFADLS